jgi:ubiquinone/menaquinone biosynthesis C-methylase UbiE
LARQNFINKKNLQKSPPPPPQYGNLDAVILDIGSGYNMEILANKKIKYRKKVAMDLALNKNIHPEIEKHEGLVEENILKFADNSCNAVIFNGVLEHLENPLVVLREIYRILEPGGGSLC